MDHLRRKTLTLADLSGVVLDEADEMLHMGFIEDVEWILGKVPEGAQTALFSATMPPPIKKIAQNYLTDPQEIQVKSDTQELATIEQRFWMVRGVRKDTALVRFLEATEFDGVIVFTRTRTATLEVTKSLEDAGFRAEALNGDMAQAARERTVERLKSGRIDILVATDVAARGLDVDRISHVVNYDMADKIDPYVHRIGRTGRAGRQGVAILFLRRNERWLVRRIERATKQSLKEVFLPTNQEINDRRRTRFQERITQTLEGLGTANGSNDEMNQFKELIQSYMEATEAPALDVAAALAKMAHGKSSFLLPPEAPKARREKGKNKARDGRNGGKFKEPRPLPPPANGMERYRIQVGRTNGIKARDVVGAISNEAGLEGKFIRNVTINHDHSLVDLPQGMPRDIFKHLKKVRLRQRRMDIAVASA
ncbi:MAG: DbpA RNA binding domain-containing protein, partial [Desulfobacterales bacterium]|nr:DbpA RNA binding domain-containing protein [Desulfobacterales bacterium]